MRAHSASKCRRFPLYMIAAGFVAALQPPWAGRAASSGGAVTEPRPTDGFLTVSGPALQSVDELAEHPRSGNAEETFPLARNAACPRSYSLDVESGQCFKERFVSPEAVCPDYTTEVAGECAVFDAPRFTCPHAGPESELVNGFCFSHFETPPTLACPNGDPRDNRSATSSSLVFNDATLLSSDGPLDSSGGSPLPSDSREAALLRAFRPGFLDSGTCRQTLRERPVCPEGFVATDQLDSCERIVAATEICPEDSVLVDGQCERNRVVSPVPACDMANFTFDPSRNACTRVVQPPTTCPDGFTSADDGQTCLRYAPHVRGDCPAGDGGADRCMVRREFAPDLMCPPGFLLEQERCVKHVQPPATCGVEAAEFLPDLGVCRTSAPAELMCPLGSSLESEECVEREELPAVVSCPSEFHLTGNACKRVERVAARPACTRGELKFESGAAICVVEAALPPIVFCPEGYQLVKGFQCAREIEFACPDTVVSEECEVPDFSGIVPDDFSAESGPAAEVPGTLIRDYKVKLDRKSAGNTGRGRIVSRLGAGVSKTPACAEVHRQILHTCRRTEFIDVVVGCEPGAALRDHQCVSATQHAAVQYTCPGSGEFQLERREDSRDPAWCARITTAPATLTCPENSMPAHHGAGPDISVTAPDQENSVQSREPVAAERWADNPTRTLPRLEPGRRLQAAQTDKSLEDVPALCIRVTRSSPAVECGPGTVLANSESGPACMRYSDPETAPQDVVLYRNPQPLCAVGELHGASCVVVESVARPLICPAGFAPNEWNPRACVQVRMPIAPQALVLEQPASFQCPGDSVADGAVCVRKEVVASANRCDEAGAVLQSLDSDRPVGPGPAEESRSAELNLAAVVGSYDSPNRDWLLANPSSDLGFEGHAGGSHHPDSIERPYTSSQPSTSDRPSGHSNSKNALAASLSETLRSRPAPTEPATPARSLAVRREQEEPRGSSSEPPPGSPEAVCVIRVEPLRRPERTLQVPPARTCPTAPGETAELTPEGRCRVTRRRAALASCDPPFERYKKDQCVRSVPRELRCPAASRPLQSPEPLQCVEKVWAPPAVTRVKICPPGVTTC